jgi:hypothetical protein
VRACEFIGFRNKASSGTHSSLLLKQLFGRRLLLLCDTIVTILLD